KYRCRADEPRPHRRDVERSDLGAFIRAARRISVERRKIVKGIRGLKPGTRVLEIPVQRILLGDLVVHAVENVLFVALVVYRCKLRRIQESSASQAVRGNEVAPLL